MMEEITLKCVKCGSSPAYDPCVTLFRFPEPGRQCAMWAKFCFPCETWASAQFQKKIYTKQTMLCHKHFKKMCFKDILRNELCEDAIPSETCEDDITIFNIDKVECSTNVVKLEEKMRAIGSSPKMNKTSKSAMVCIICLDTDRKLHLLSDYKLEEAYQNVTGLSFHNDFNLAPTLCTECAHRLTNCYKFRDKSLRANTLLLELHKKHEKLSVQNIKTVNRVNNELTSNLIQKVYEPNYCDHHIVEYDDDKNYEIAHTFIEKFEQKYENLDDVVLVVGPKEETFSCIDDNHIADFENVEYLNFDNEDTVFDDVDTKHECNDEVGKIYNIEFSNDDDSDKCDKDDADEIQKNTLNKEKKNTFQYDTKSVSNYELTLFKITELTHDEQVAELEKRKEKKSYQRSIYKCTMCYKGFNNKNSHSRHMLKHTDKCGSFACTLCKLHFVSYQNRLGHMKGCHTTTYSCTACQFITKNKRVAELHERWHNGIKYKCPECNEEFDAHTTLMSHRRIKHPSDSICHFCGFSFISEKGLRLHIAFKHRFETVKNPRGPECAACNVRFATAAAYEQHKKVSPKHNGDGPCVRNDSFQTPEPKLRLPKDIIKCELCGVKVKDYNVYTWHFKRAHPGKNRTIYAAPKRPHLCEQCGRAFKYQSQLDYHMAVHSADKPFQCDLCMKRFALKGQLVLHLNRHSDNQRMYECKVCKKSFNDKGNRERHAWIHYGKLFRCEICDKSFATPAEKRVHAMHVHMKIPWPKKPYVPKGRTAKAGVNAV